MTDLIKRRLKNIRIKSIAFVDQGANMRDFAIYKKKGDNKMSKDKKVEKQNDIAEALGKIVDALKEENIKDALSLVNALLKEVEKIEKKEYPINKGAVVDVIEKVITMLKDGPNMNKISEAIGLLYEADVTLKDKLMDVDINNLETISKSVLDNVEKAGKKFSKKTLEKIQSAVKSLQDLLSEVENVKTDEDVKKIEKSMSEDEGSGAGAGDGGAGEGEGKKKDGEGEGSGNAGNEGKGSGEGDGKGEGSGDGKDEEPNEEEQKEIEKMALEIAEEDLKKEANA